MLRASGVISKGGGYWGEVRIYWGQKQFVKQIQERVWNEFCAGIRNERGENEGTFLLL